MKKNFKNIFALAALACFTLSSCGGKGGDATTAEAQDEGGIPENVTYLSVKDHNARNGAQLNIEKLGYNAKVKDATDGEFEGNKNIKEIYFTDEFMNVGVEAFKDCSNLTKIGFGEKGIIQVINDNAFENCTSLTSINGPVRTFGVEAFKGCTSLESVITTDELWMVRSGAFANCPNLKKVILATTMVHYGSDQNVVDADAFEGSPNVEEISIPAKCSTMFGYIKNTLKNLKKVYILSTEYYPFPQSGEGFVADGADLYVADYLVDQFKADASWSKFKNILPLSQSEYFDENCWRK